jgi:hypothetical protein
MDGKQLRLLKSPKKILRFKASCAMAKSLVESGALVQKAWDLIVRLCGHVAIQL